MGGAKSSRTRPIASHTRPTPPCTRPEASHTRPESAGYTGYSDPAQSPLDAAADQKSIKWKGRCPLQTSPQTAVFDPREQSPLRYTCPSGRLCDTPICQGCAAP